MSRVTAEAIFAPLRQLLPEKPRQAAPDTPFAAFLDAPSETAATVPDSQNAALRPAKDTEDTEDAEEGRRGAVVVSPVNLLATAVDAPPTPAAPDPTAQPALVRASSASFGEASAPQNTAFAAVPDPNNSDDTLSDIASPAPATGQAQAASGSELPSGIVAAGVETPPTPPTVLPPAQPAKPPLTQAAAPATSPEPGQAAATVATLPAGEAGSSTPSSPGADAADDAGQPKPHSAGGSFDALLHKAVESSGPTPGQPLTDGEPAALEPARPGLDGPPQLQASNTTPQPTPERLGHLTPAAPAAHTGQAATAETSAAVPVAGLAIEIAARAQSGHSRFEVRLDPPELGRIDVRLDVDHRGHVTSRLVVEKSETLDLLKRDAPELERALQQAGLKTGDGGLQFTLRDQAFAGRDDRSAAETARVVVPEAELAPVEIVRSGYGRLLRLDGGLDIRV